MNYLPYCGYWFYGAINSEQRASYYDSWGLLLDAPEYVPSANEYPALLRMGMTTTTR